MPAPSKTEQDKQSADKAKAEADARERDANAAAEKAAAAARAADAVAKVQADEEVAARDRAATLPEWLVEVRDSPLAPATVRAADASAAAEQYKQDRGIWALPAAATVTKLG